MGVSGKGTGVGWVVAKTKTKKQDYTNGRVLSGYAVHMYPHWANNIPEGLDRHVLTVQAISGLSIIDVEPTISTTSWIYMVGKKHSGKTDQLTLASGGSEHA